MSKSILKIPLRDVAIEYCSLLCYKKRDLKYLTSHRGQPSLLEQSKFQPESHRYVFPM